MYATRAPVVEKSDRPGGVCALAGCQAKKWFYEVTETVARSRHLAGRGITRPPAVDWAAILARKNAFTGPIPAGMGPDFSQPGQIVHQGRCMVRSTHVAAWSGRAALWVRRLTRGMS